MIDTRIMIQLLVIFSVILWKPEREGDQKEANGRKIIKTIKNKDG